LGPTESLRDVALHGLCTLASLPRDPEFVRSAGHPSLKKKSGFYEEVIGGHSRRIDEHRAAAQQFLANWGTTIVMDSSKLTYHSACRSWFRVEGDCATPGKYKRNINLRLYPAIRPHWRRICNNAASINPKVTFGDRWIQTLLCYSALPTAKYNRPLERTPEAKSGAASVHTANINWCLFCLQKAPAADDSVEHIFGGSCTVIAEAFRLVNATADPPHARIPHLHYSAEHCRLAADDNVGAPLATATCLANNAIWKARQLRINDRETITVPAQAPQIAQAIAARIAMALPKPKPRRKTPKPSRTSQADARVP
jgi:hypothetical protein